MIQKIQKVITDYINKDIDSEKCVQSFKEIYVQILESDNLNFELDIIPQMPVIHELAFSKCTNGELDHHIEQLRGIISGNQEYHYDAFYKLNIPNDSKEMIALHDKYDEIELDELLKVFATEIKNTKTLRDILFNLLYDILSKINLQDVDECEFDYVNCSDDITLDQLKSWIMVLLSYYLGITPFYLQISYSPDKGRICIIT